MGSPVAPRGSFEDEGLKLKAGEENLRRYHVHVEIPFVPAVIDRNLKGFVDPIAVGGKLAPISERSS
jgi:hypothetical protein